MISSRWATGVGAAIVGRLLTLRLSLPVATPGATAPRTGCPAAILRWSSFSSSWPTWRWASFSRLARPRWPARPASRSRWTK
eukprot:7578052-Alexandrium_andersonii.AAC.1